MKKRKGFSLGVVLILVIMMATMGTAMVALFTTNLNLLQASNNGQVALNEAEAGLNQVLLNVAADPDYGANNETLTRTLNPSFPSSECYHQVSFNSSQTAIPFSTNAKAGATTGYGGRPVPAECLHVVSVGVCRGQIRTVEAILRQPPFNFALASAGSINSATPMRVEGVDSRTAYVQGTSKPLPGHIASNSLQGITVGAGSIPSYISGYARATGLVNMDASATVVDGMRPNSSPLPLPSINVQSFDPAGTPGLQVISTSSSNVTQLSATQRCNQSTVFTEAVRFTNGLLYVKGEVTFSKGVKGTGAIIAEGNVTIQGVDSQVSGTDTLAILSDGAVTMQGDPNNTVTPTVSANYINGLVYGAKGVDLSDVTVAGIVLTQDGQSSTKLNNTNLMYASDVAALNITISAKTDDGGAGLPPIFEDTSTTPSRIFFGEPPPGVQATQVTTPPAQSWDSYLYLAAVNGQLNAGNLTNYPGADVAATQLLGNQANVNATLANTNVSNVPPYTQGQLALNQAVTAYSGGTSATNTSWNVTTPGSTFKIDLNNFLPRSSTLRVTAYCVHNSRI